MKKNHVVTVATILTVVNLLILQQWQISNLNNQLEISDMRAKVNTEFADELLWLQLNDVQKMAEENLIAQGRVEGMVNYYAQDSEDRQHIDNLWHEGYMRGLSQVDWEYDAVSEVNYNKGYREAIETAFPDGKYPSFVNLPPREVDTNAIAEPEFDKKSEGLKDNLEVIDSLNEKIKEVKDSE